MHFTVNSFEFVVLETQI